MLSDLLTEQFWGGFSPHGVRAGPELTSIALVSFSFPVSAGAEAVWLEMECVYIYTAPRYPLYTYSIYTHTYIIFPKSPPPLLVDAYVLVRAPGTYFYIFYIYLHISTLAHLCKAIVLYSICLLHLPPQPQLYLHLSLLIYPRPALFIHIT